MNDLVYTRILSDKDVDIPYLLKIYQLPDVSRFLSISDNYFHYVTSTENVYFYKIYDNKKLIGTTHFEKCEDLLFMDILIFPEYQRMGFATRVIKDIQNDVFELNYKRIEISIDEKNKVSIKLFENAGFIFVSKEDELLNYSFHNLFWRNNMTINCVWEHNGNDTLLYAIDFIGAYTRGESLEVAKAKMPAEIASYLKWLGKDAADSVEITVAQEKSSDLAIKDADSDVLFESEKASLTVEEYEMLKALALKSAKDFLTLYESIPDRSATASLARKTFYGQVPRTADEMYEQTSIILRR